MKKASLLELFICLLLLCGIGAPYRAAAADIAAFRQSLAKETPGSEQWKKLHKEFCDEAKKSPEQLEQAIAFYRDELKRENAPEISALLWEFQGELEQSSRDCISAIFSFSQAIGIYSQAIRQTERALAQKQNKAVFLSLHEKCFGVAQKRHKCFRSIARSAAAEKKFVMASTEKKHVNWELAADILISYASFISSGEKRNFSKAKECLNAARKILEENGCSNTENMASLYNILAFVERRSGNIEFAEQLYLRSQGIYEFLLGINHPRTVSQYSRIGSFYDIVGNYNQAEKYYLKAIELGRKLYDEDTLAKRYTNLAIFYNKFSNETKAINACLKSIEITENLYGRSSLQVIDGKLFLVELLVEKKDFSAAQKNLDECLAICKGERTDKKFDKYRRDVRIAFARFFYEVGDYENAHKYLTEAEKFLPQRKKNAMHAKVYYLRAKILSAQKKYSDALLWTEKARVIYKKAWGDRNFYVRQTYELTAEIYRSLQNPSEAEKYERLAHAIGPFQPRNIYSELWQNARSGNLSNLTLEKYISLLKDEIISRNEIDTKKRMNDLITHAVNSSEFADKLVVKFDSLEAELRQKKQVQEQILFLKGFSETGFSDLFPEARKNYFGNLEDTLDEEKLSVEKQLLALTVLASDYLRNETFFADGKERSAEAIEKAKESKQFSTALKLYQITLRRLLQFDDKKFDVIRKDAEKTAQSCSNAEYQTVFKTLGLLHRLKGGNGKNAIAELQKLAASHTAAVSAEIVSFIEYDPELLNREDVDIVRLLSGVSTDIISSAAPMLRRRIASVLLNKKQENEAKKWFSSVTSAIDRLLYLNTLANGLDLVQLSANLKQLESLKPEAFELNGKKYSADDMRLLLQLTRCKYAKSLSDDSLLLTSARQVEELLNSGKCSKDFKGLLRTDCLTVLFDYNYLLGDFQQAKSQIEQILSSKGSDPVSRAQYLMRHGMCCMALGENQNAAKSLREAGEILRESKYKDQAIICYRNLACAEYRAGNYTEALTAMRNCAAVNSITDHKEDTSVTEAILIVELAELYHSKELGRKGKEDEFKRLLLRAKRLSQPGNIADFALAEAMFRRDIIRRPKINEQIQSLERYFNYTRSTTQESLLRYPLFLPMRESEAQKMLLLTLKSAGDVGKLDFWNKKFEQGRVRSLTVSSAPDHGRVEAEDFADMNMLEIIAQCSDARAIVETEKSKPQDQRDEKLIQAATSTLRRLENLFEVKKMRLAKEKAAKFNALMADNFVIHPDSMNQLSAVLPVDTACLQFIPVDDEIIVYIISHNAPPIMHQIDLKKHQKNAGSFFNQIRKLRTILQRAGSNERVQRELNAVYKIVFAELEAPLAKMQTKKLLVNSSGILRYIPFAALYDGQNFLVEKYQVTNATGLDLVRLSRNAAKRQYAKTRIAVFADPDGSLPSGRKEGGTVAEFFPQKQIFTGQEASLAKLESLTGSVNFIHLATHGVIDPTTPRNSYIMMANGRNWRYCDMMGFNVENVDSIVLSACNTAMSENCSGGEIEGMAYQLLKKSPSGSVVASFWKVDDKATSKLMTAYYSHIAKSLKDSQTLDRGGALRAAQLELLRSPETRDPYYWAAFTLFGDCR